MVGFAEIEIKASGNDKITIVCKKASQAQPPAKIKRKAKPEAPSTNPWANLAKEEDQINENDLLKESGQLT